MPAKLNWKRADGVVRIEQTTQYPNQLSTMLAISLDNPSEFALNIRIPSWSTSRSIIRVNGREFRHESAVKGSIRVMRTWQNGDKVSIQFGAEPRLEPIDPLSPNTVALMYGPLLYVALSDKPVDLAGPHTHPAEWLVSAPAGSDLVTRDGKFTFRPFYQVQNEHYTTYCRFRDATPPVAR